MLTSCADFSTAGCLCGQLKFWVMKFLQGSLSAPADQASEASTEPGRGFETPQFTMGRNWVKAGSDSRLYNYPLDNTNRRAV